ncbi:MAG: glutamine--tRNA ligase/YqeY domain fusion protein [Kiritimatiellia bacterium]|jgi:glutaminyl-tRNA synthetase
MTTDTNVPNHFIKDIIISDLQAGKNDGKVVTRFPPEPNGYLHIGHAKSICMNFGLAKEFGGPCHLRFDDTNPATEDVEYVDAIQEDIRWLGFDWGQHLYFASDYYQYLYDCAERLIQLGLAYVCDLTTDDFKEYRGVPTQPGRPSPWRDRPAAESLDLFRRMKAGEFADGQYVLRAKIDMASPNLHMRDPVIYRIRRLSHHRTGDTWCIYPMYDFAHCLSDAYEAITHSICTLEFEVHRPLYDWFLNALDTPCRPQQIEFARLNLTYTLMSKRKLQILVQEGIVQGWDDPRMPTLAGLRRRGYTPAAIREFCHRIGVTKFNSLTDLALLEHCLRDDLNRHATRAMAVLNPLRLVIENYPEGQTEKMEAINNPEDPAQGVREVPFSRELLIERDDFMENPPSGFYRLAPGRMVRLRYGYCVECTGLEKDPVTGEVTEVRCVYDPDSRSGAGAKRNKKIKATLHWVSQPHAKPLTVRLYDRLFTVPDPAAEDDFHRVVNPDSLQEITAMCEPALAQAAPGAHYQFERLGYFFTDPTDSRAGAPVFNRTTTLRDAWARESGKTGAG